jgi:hypothetical protein
LTFICRTSRLNQPRTRIVLVVKPRGQEIKAVLPTRVRAVDFQVVSGIVAAFVDSSELPDEQSWLLDEYADYLDEEGLMDPEALSATHAVALMEVGAAADAVAGVCEYAHSTRRHGLDVPASRSGLDADPV